jgi:hypothetical protein
MVVAAFAETFVVRTMPDASNTVLAVTADAAAPAHELSRYKVIFDGSELTPKMVGVSVVPGLPAATDENVRVT